MSTKDTSQKNVLIREYIFKIDLDNIELFYKKTHTIKRPIRLKTVPLFKGYCFLSIGRLYNKYHMVAKKPKNMYAIW